MLSVCGVFWCLQKIVKHNCQELLQSVPFFENAPEVFITAVLTRLKFELFLPEEYIVRQGFKGDRMYFIQRGIVEVITFDGKIVAHLSEGAHFGEICLLTEDRRVASIRATTTCDLFSLSKQNFEELLEEFPEMRPFFETIAKSRLGKIGHIPDEDMCNSASECRSKLQHITDTAKYSTATTCWSIPSALNDEKEAEEAVNKHSGRKNNGVEKSTSSRSVTVTRSQTSAPSTSQRLQDEQYTPHFVPDEENT